MKPRLFLLILVVLGVIYLRAGVAPPLSRDQHRAELLSVLDRLRVTIATEPQLDPRTADAYLSQVERHLSALTETDE